MELSKRLQAVIRLLTEKEEMEKLREKIEETAKDLGICQDKLNSEIWKVV